MSAAATIVLTTGGTGGHLFPAQALAEVLVARGRSVAMITDDRGAGYADRFPAGVRFHAVRAASPAGGIVAKLRAAIRLGRGSMSARTVLKSERPAAVVGFGSYAAMPALWAAGRLGLPVVLHEQNAHLGRVNRVAARRARAVALSFPDTRAVPDWVETVTVGNPVRDAILAVRERDWHAPGHDGPIRLLVFGGSQGASIFSRVVPGALASLPDTLRARLAVVQQVRPEDGELVRAAYADAGIQAELSPFFADMAERLAAAHLVIARSGASTVAELTVAGRPSVLVPYPHAADDHQTANAMALKAAGAAWTVPDAKFDIATCRRTVEALLEDPAALAAMAGAARAAGRPDAAMRLADLVEGVAGLNGHPEPGREAA